MKPIWEAAFSKKRIALGAGKSGGARSVIAFKFDENLFFVNGWNKSDIKKHGGKEISDDDLAARNSCLLCLRLK